MQLMQKIKRKAVTCNALTLFAAITLSAVVATNAMAAGGDVGGGTGHAGAPT